MVLTSFFSKIDLMCVVVFPSIYLVFDLQCSLCADASCSDCSQAYLCTGCNISFCVDCKSGFQCGECGDKLCGECQHHNHCDNDKCLASYCNQCLSCCLECGGEYCYRCQHKDYCSSKRCRYE